MAEQNNCPFYGHHIFAGAAGGFLLLCSGGNECAAIRSSFSPCMMQQSGMEIDWRMCPILAEIRVPFREAGEPS